MMVLVKSIVALLIVATGLVLDMIVVQLNLMVMIVAFVMPQVHVQLQIHVQKQVEILAGRVMVGVIHQIIMRDVHMMVVIVVLQHVLMDRILVLLMVEHVMIA